MLIVVASGCRSLSYVVHVSGGQLRLLWDRERLDPAVIEGLSPEEQAGVRTIAAARAYAEDLGLLPSTSYRHVVQRDEQSSVHVVVASPADRLEALTWWFPIVGSMAYLGYFDPERARGYAAELQQEGYDTYVRIATFYSTLGYFDDPIPSLALRWSAIDLTDVILHELVHGTIFVSGDSAYNEALASFIAREATLRFLADRPNQLTKAQNVYADRARYTEMIEALARDLESVYAESSDPGEARARRQVVFDRYQQEVYPSMGFETERYVGFTRIPLNNAFVVAQRTYSSLLPCFAAELAAMQGDLPRFIRAHREDPGRRTEPASVCPPSP